MDSSSHALSRIDAALARIESALPKRLAERDLLATQHDALREEVSQALGDIDALIADASEGNGK
ncbi:MAG: hypothetical protein COW16_09295 [Sphingomonadales bacterium CG12_big_fil_rev_8_21_14_0_65_65_10]|uniref:DUF904 domain-containing protein n=1 Tax=Blastomonas marina TaxID=1867408 RepID=A0ABQ1FAL1_9SPHN|nr:hypothetical protein [Blastomonas marina]PIW54817.1 MAG: hypothetical protein COW16_09295 [Sphingomonadales bacterium CG12_big_fil_rev_8_21_14_0_65_65_10]WPZ04833.1 hypothetical protein T8S45_04640 [Blastomonas marina]GGA04439.1 hypothetical protein GCM10010923_12190 [Blastomonas marina]